MDTAEFVVYPVKKTADWLRIRILYRFSFPRSERKPFRIIRRMHEQGKTDILCISHEGRFCGFASTINGSDGTLLDYLAVRRKLRGRGAGSAMMKHMLAEYGKTGLIVEIENAFEKCANRDERIRRRNFYIRNGMQPLDVFASVFGVNMEILGCGVDITFDRYREFYRSNYSDYAANHILPADSYK